jgi:predicted RNA-binding Zn ribbon-like protein
MFGAAALALLNTDRAGDGDLLDGAWLTRAAPAWGVAVDRPVGPGDIAEFRTLRALLRRLADVVAVGNPLSTSDLAAFNEVLERTPVRAQLIADGERYVVDMTPVTTGWREFAIREVAGSFSAMLRADPSRLKLCAAPGCGRAFWDDTRSRTRTWCDSRTCGNRVRVRRHRAARTDD